jgi:hypothetical protein
VNVNVGEETRILESKGQYSHVNFWASPDDGSGATLFFAEFRASPRVCQNSLGKSCDLTSA